MLAESRYKAYIGIGFGFILIIVGRVISKPDAPIAIAGNVIALGGWALLVWACCHYARAKGHSAWWGLLGFLSIIGLLILFSFPDRGRESETRVMPSRDLLRTLVVAEIGLGVVGVVASILTESSLPKSLQSFLQEEAEAEITVRDWVMLSTGIPILILYIVSSIGLFFFWRPARILYIITTFAGLLATPFFGPYVDTGLGDMFDEAAVIISGVIIGLIYFSPLKNLFDQPKIESQQGAAVGSGG